MNTYDQPDAPDAPYMELCVCGHYGFVEEIGADDKCVNCTQDNLSTVPALAEPNTGWLRTQAVGRSARECNSFGVQTNCKKDSRGGTQTNLGERVKLRRSFRPDLTQTSLRDTFYRPGTYEIK